MKSITQSIIKSKLALLFLLSTICLLGGTRVIKPIHSLIIIEVLIAGSLVNELGKEEKKNKYFYNLLNKLKKDGDKYND